MCLGGRVEGEVRGRVGGGTVCGGRKKVRLNTLKEIRTVVYVIGYVADLCYVSSL